MIDFSHQDGIQPEVLLATAPTDYEAALTLMKDRVRAIQAKEAGELLWFLEHPPLITLGTSAKSEDVLDTRFPIHPTGRGGQATYHGPGQLILYLMLDLGKRKKDVRAFVAALESMLIKTLAHFGIPAMRREGRVGVWVQDPQSRSGEAKIAALGIRLSRWVTFHGISINIDPDLAHFETIVPCGIRDHGVTSLKALGVQTTRDEVTKHLLDEFHALF